MIEPAECGACGHSFEAPEHLAGGITNCPRCGKAVDVPGLRDPLWRMWQLGMPLAGAVAGVLAGQQLGVAAGIGIGVAVAVGLWLISRAF